MSWLQFCFDSALSEIFIVSMVVNQICKRLDLDEVPAYEIELCAVEAVTNSIRHAYHNEPGHKVRILVRFDPERIDIEVSDQGESMAPNHLDRLRKGSPGPEFDPLDIQSLPEGGMGLSIIRAIMDEISYSSEGGRNCLKLSKVLARRSSAPSV